MNREDYDSSREQPLERNHQTRLEYGEGLDASGNYEIKFLTENLS
jgi:hypothetical protein